MYRQLVTGKKVGGKNHLLTRYKYVGDGIGYNGIWDETAERKKNEVEESKVEEDGVKAYEVQRGDVEENGIDMRWT